MHISTFCIPVQFSEDRVFLVNGLTGEHSLLNQAETRQFLAWKQEGISSAEQNDFLNELLAHKYVFQTEAEEAAEEKKTLQLAKDLYEKDKHVKSATFVLSYRCNYKCPYCYEQDNWTKSNDTVMSEKQVDKVFSAYDDQLDTIGLYGGEPLLPEHENIIRYIFRKAPVARYSVTTNGYYLEHFLPLLRERTFGHIMVTLDGDREIHNKTRILRSDGSGTFDTVMRGIRAALRENMTVKIRMNIHEGNADSCLALREKMKTDFSESFENRHLCFEMQSLFQLSTEEKDKLNKKIMAYDVKRDAHFTQNNMMQEKTSRLLQHIYTRRPFSPMYCACGAESDMRFYDNEGYIYTCTLAVGNTIAAVGRYDPELQMKQDGYLFRNIETIKKCSTCPYKFLCGGGCANEVMDENGFCLYPNCRQFQHEISATLPGIYREILK